MKKIWQTAYLGVFKPALDFCCSLLILLCFGWLFLLVAALVRTKLGSPVIFKQPRPGKNGRTFYIRKFRTMTNETDENGKLLPREQRLTPFGKKLRSTSLDELPEIFNVLRGEMSLVGPRPLRVEYLPLYSREQARRHDVLPGITGWAQVCGRNNITWERKFELDVEYVDRVSFLLDVKILFLTLYKTFKREGADNIATGEGVFMGNAQDANVDYRWYDEQTSYSFDDLLHFIQKCDVSFEPPLESRGVDLREYATKLTNKAKIRLALKDGVIVGLIAFYCYEFETRNAFITWLGVDESGRSQGVGKRLVGDAFDYARNLGFKTCGAQVSNEAAIKIYCKRYGGKIIGSKMEGTVKKQLVSITL